MRIPEDTLFVMNLQIDMKKACVMASVTCAVIGALVCAPFICGKVSQ